jgi:hypothetical protein
MAKFCDFPQFHFLCGFVYLQDNHKYFKSRYYPSGERWWFDLNDGSGTPKLHVGLTKNLQYSDVSSIFMQ